MLAPFQDPHSTIEPSAAFGTRRIVVAIVRCSTKFDPDSIRTLLRIIFSARAALRKKPTPYSPPVPRRK